MKVEGTDDIYDLTPAPGTVTEEGTFLNVENLLKDTTAALLGGDANMVPDEAFVVLKISSLKIAYGNYVGTGTYGELNPCSLTFDFVPKVLVIIGATRTANKVTGKVTYTILRDMETFGDSYTCNITKWDTTVSWYSEAETDDVYPSYTQYTQMNGNGLTYRYYALGN